MYLSKKIAKNLTFSFVNFFYKEILFTKISIELNIFLLPTIKAIKYTTSHKYSVNRAMSPNRWSFEASKANKSAHKHWNLKMLWFNGRRRVNKNFWWWWITKFTIPDLQLKNFFCIIFNFWLKFNQTIEPN